MRISVFTFGPFSVNTYILWDEESKQAAIVDPGMTNDDEIANIDHFLDEKKLHVKYLINTHLHIDHAIGNRHITTKYDVSCSASPLDSDLGLSLAAQSRMFGLPYVVSPVIISNQLKNGDSLPLGNESLEIITVPGHSRGSIAIYCPQSGFLISGDTLFKESVGRTDLPGGNAADLIHSIRHKLFSYPDETIVCPGHGPTTTIGHEKNSNPFI